MQEVRRQRHLSLVRTPRDWGAEPALSDFQPESAPPPVLVSIPTEEPPPVAKMHLPPVAPRENHPINQKKKAKKQGHPSVISFFSAFLKHDRPANRIMEEKVHKRGEQKTEAVTPQEHGVLPSTTPEEIAEATQHLVNQISLLRREENIPDPDPIPA